MPKIVQHDERREAIARAAWRTIARAGVESSTVRAIARDAGCSTGVLQHYFPDKDALLLHALRLVTRQTGGRMADRARGARGLAALRSVLFEALPLDADSRLEWRIWLAFWGRAVLDADLAAEQRRRYREWRGLIRTLLRGAQRRGELPARLDAVREADALVAFIDGLGLGATLEPARLPPRRQAAMVDGYLGGMGRRKKDEGRRTKDE